MSTKVTLNTIQRAKLVSFIEANYIGSGMSFDEFAVRATEALGFHITRGHIRHVMRLLGYKSERREHNPNPGGASDEEMRDQLAAAISDVAYLDGEINLLRHAMSEQRTLQVTFANQLMSLLRMYIASLGNPAPSEQAGNTPQESTP